MRILITGGAGFIGSALVRKAVLDAGHDVLNVDCLTYAGNLESLEAVQDHPRYRFSRTDVRDAPALQRLFASHRPEAVMHLAAESHVDRSIDGPGEFIQTNIVGTYTLLQVARAYHDTLSGPARDGFRVLHVSTDEVFGSLGADGLFSESSPYEPSSPYAASKASADHLARAWHHTFGLPVLVTNCSNNYGPYQFPEKLIPLMILNGLEGRQLPVYGRGDNVRDWLFVDDHAQALLVVVERGRIGETYNIGGNSERSNIQVVTGICDLLDELRPADIPRRSLITFVEDRPGHDRRYAIDASKIRRELGFVPTCSFESGLERTVKWYLEQESGWCARVRDGSYLGERLGLSGTGGSAKQ